MTACKPNAKTLKASVSRVADRFTAGRIILEYSLANQGKPVVS